MVTTPTQSTEVNSNAEMDIINSTSTWHPADIPSPHHHPRLTAYTVNTTEDDNSNNDDDDLDLSLNRDSRSTVGTSDNESRFESDTESSGLSFMTGQFISRPNDQLDIGDFSPRDSTSSDFLFTPISEDIADMPASFSSDFDSDCSDADADADNDDDGPSNALRGKRSESSLPASVPISPRTPNSEHLPPSPNTTQPNSRQKQRHHLPQTTPSIKILHPAAIPLTKQRSSPHLLSHQHNQHQQQQHQHQQLRRQLRKQQHQQHHASTVTDNGSHNHNHPPHKHNNNLTIVTKESPDPNTPPLVVVTTRRSSSPLPPPTGEKDGPYAPPYQLRNHHHHGSSGAGSKGRPPRNSPPAGSFPISLRLLSASPPCGIKERSRTVPGRMVPPMVGMRSQSPLSSSNATANDNNNDYDNDDEDKAVTTTGTNDLLLSSPIRLTRSSSTPDSYRITYSKSARKSPWEKLLSSSASFLSSAGVSKRSSSSTAGGGAGGGGGIDSLPSTATSLGDYYGTGSGYGAGSGSRMAVSDGHCSSSTSLSIRTFSIDEDDVEGDGGGGRKRSDPIFRGTTPTAHSTEEDGGVGGDTADGGGGRRRSDSIFRGPTPTMHNMEGSGDDSGAGSDTADGGGGRRRSDSIFRGTTPTMQNMENITDDPDGIKGRRRSDSMFSDGSGVKARRRSDSIFSDGSGVKARRMSDSIYRVTTPTIHNMENGGLIGDDGDGIGGRQMSYSICRGTTPTAHNMNHKGFAGAFAEEKDEEACLHPEDRTDESLKMQLSTSFDRDDNDGSRFETRYFDTTHHHDPDDSSMRNIVQQVSTDQTKNTFVTFFTFAQIKDKSHFIHLCVFAVFGSSLRITLGRIFGRDCEFPNEVHDFISHLSTCVTASGTTEQRGGALFLDLPANVLGSFFMGVLTPVNQKIPPIPWLETDHRLQGNAPMHFGVRVAFCGSLTTFASWNTQMIVMMAGKGTKLGRQICPALFGYGVGLICAVSSFLIGRQAADFLYNHYKKKRKRKYDANKRMVINNMRTESMREGVVVAEVGAGGTDGGDGDIEKSGVENIDWTNTKTTFGTTDDVEISQRSAKFPRVITLNVSKFRGHCSVSSLCALFNRKYIYLIVALLLFSMFVVGDFVLGIRFYRQVWISSLFALPGSLLRWNLSFLNGQLFLGSERLRWVPWGTLTTNVLGCIISVIAQAMIIRLDDDAVSLKRLLLVGMKTGLAGNISTVSTFVKEIVHLYEKFPNNRNAYIYATGSLLLCCVLSLCIYLPVVFT